MRILESQTELDSTGDKYSSAIYDVNKTRGRYLQECVLMLTDGEIENLRMAADMYGVSMGEMVGVLSHLYLERDKRAIEEGVRPVQLWHSPPPPGWSWEKPKHPREAAS
ncbi:MAG TPA: hypothetical protein VNC78_06160 [Actinomycetota bacterium]|nr:hypothetical protein [Actinomycetota bacterium]